MLNELLVAATIAMPFRVVDAAAGVPPRSPGLRLPVVFLIPAKAGKAAAHRADVAAEAARFDAVWSQCGIALDVRSLVSFELSTPLDAALAAGILERTALSDPDSGSLSGSPKADEADLYPRIAGTFAQAAGRYRKSGLSVFYLDPILGAGSPGYGFSDPESGLVVIGGREGKETIWAKLLAHELGHVILEEWNRDGDNLMSDAADQLEKPSTALTEKQCVKARAYVEARWPVSPASP